MRRRRRRASVWHTSGHQKKTQWPRWETAIFVPSFWGRNVSASGQNSSLSSVRTNCRWAAKSPMLCYCLILIQDSYLETSDSLFVHLLLLTVLQKLKRPVALHWHTAQLVHCHLRTQRRAEKEARAAFLSARRRGVGPGCSEQGTGWEMAPSKHSSFFIPLMTPHLIICYTST